MLFKNCGFGIPESNFVDLDSERTNSKYCFPFRWLP